MPFRDQFSQQARTYAQFRPRYPADLFAYLASIAPGRGLAWDCATGNGQAALELARHFERVAASDASANQMANSFRNGNVGYLVGQAERVALTSGTVDLITVAQAIHWFDLDIFYREVERLLRRGGVLAAWTYHLMQSNPALDRILADYYYDVLGSYWSPRMRLLDERYRTLPFPFEEVMAPAFTMEAVWDLDDPLGFLNSWSANRKFEEERGYHPLEKVQRSLADAWGPDGQRTVQWPLHFRIGRVVT